MNLYIDKILEVLGAAFSLHSVWALTNGKNIGWITGLIGIVLSATIFYFFAHLYGQLALQAYFAVTSVYGWLNWKLQLTKDFAFIPLERLSQIDLWGAVIGFVALWPVCYYLLLWLDGSEPGIDALAFTLSMVAQYLQTKRYTVSWLIWIVVNIVSIWLFYLIANYTYTLLYFALLYNNGLLRCFHLVTADIVVFYGH